jgi:uncharacterized protein (DUF2062 family)
MKDFAHSPGTAALNAKPETAINRRIFRGMAVTVIVATLICLFFAPWRVAAGVAVGGVLSLLNFSWMKTSIAAALSVAYTGKKPQIRIAQYLLRYLVVAVVVLGAYQLNLVSLPATIFGLCSFVPALFIEAAREFYFAIIRREEVG